MTVQLEIKKPEPEPVQQSKCRAKKHHNAPRFIHSLEGSAVLSTTNIAQ